MILDEVVLDNFGVYKGRQKFNLTPASRARPIILMGALNGGGKTTFLDALQLAFFGKLSQCSARGKLAYHDYLLRSIHQAVPKGEGAAVEVKFRQNLGGDEHTFRIHRSWSMPNGTVREQFEVIRNGRIDRVLTDQWAEHVEEMLPSRVASLFFFDGEKIEEYADLERSSEILSTAIHSLLGLDIVNRLKTDLEVLERRKQTSLHSERERKEIETAKSELERLEARFRDETQMRAALNTELGRRQAALEDANALFQREGGLLFEQREELNRKRAEAVHRRDLIEDSMRELASQSAPLLILRGALARISDQDKAEEATKQALAVLDVLVSRDELTLSHLRDHGVDEFRIEALRAFMVNDRHQRRHQAERDRYLHLSEEGQERLSYLRSGALSRCLSEVTTQMDELVVIEQEIMDLDRQISGIPTPEAIEPIVERVAKAEVAVATISRDLTQKDDEIARLGRDLDAQKTSLRSHFEKGVHLKLADDDNKRILLHSGRVRRTLDQFRKRVVQHHLTDIENRIVRCFHSLLRKDTLVSAVDIDPESFQITLRGEDWRPLPPERLSAGERQLFAVSLLWSLAQASGRIAPAVIDTPLGRLDSHHRRHLVERYFPAASHQVLLLSTDEEIDARYYKALEPHVSRTYRLDYDQESGGTRVLEGYFF